MTIEAFVQLALNVCLLLPWSLGAQTAETVVFQGVPVVKVEMMDGQVASRNLSSAEAQEYRVRITRRGDKYYWANRKNAELIKIDNTGFITYISPDGFGYVKTMSPLLLEVYKKLPKDQQEKDCVYMEHAMKQLGSVTYFGR